MIAVIGRIELLLHFMTDERDWWMITDRRIQPKKIQALIGAIVVAVLLADFNLYTAVEV